MHVPLLPEAEEEEASARCCLSLSFSFSMISGEEQNTGNVIQAAKHGERYTGWRNMENVIQAAKHGER